MSENRNTRPSFFSHKFTITSSVETDPIRWNKEWDKALHPFSAKDVYAVLSLIWTSDMMDPSETVKYPEMLKAELLKFQNVLAKLWRDMPVEDRNQFITAWSLLEERDRQTHLLRGLEEACKTSSLGVDARAMCPDIKISSLLKRQGKGYVDLISSFTKEKLAMGENDIYQFPSQWWETAVDLSNSPSAEACSLSREVSSPSQEVSSPSPEASLPSQEASSPLQEASSLSQEVNLPFVLLTMQRNEFITQFLIHATMSVLKDLAYGSTSMDPVVSILKSGIGDGIGKMVRELRDKPLIRCEKCTKSPEDIGQNVKFMLCSICKAKLDFAVYYCSPACQKEDWREHKKICGKQKSMKQLAGTIRDRYWQYPSLPEYAREIPVDPTGNVHITSLGFGKPHPSRPYSPALQRQVSLLTGDRYADYFLFDQLDRPIRFMVGDMCIKMSFRSIRSEALSSANGSTEGIAAIAEYLIKMMEHKPGLSRESILAQLSREYLEDVAEAVAKWEQSAMKHGHSPGTTFMEVMGKTMEVTLPRMMRLGK